MTTTPSEVSLTGPALAVSVRIAMVTAGESDPRVDAYHAKKFAARLQAATSSGRPVLLRISGGGHGIGAGLDDEVALLADVYAFAMHELGMTFKPLPRPAVPARK